MKSAEAMEQIPFWREMKAYREGRESGWSDGYDDGFRVGVGVTLAALAACWVVIRRVR